MNKSSLLVLQPSFIRGVGKILDIGGVTSHKYNYSSSNDEADSMALRTDWENVGQDIQSGIESYMVSENGKK